MSEDHLACIEAVNADLTETPETETSTPRDKRKLWTIYLITLRIDGRRYVGQTTKPLFLRWAGHIEAAHRTAPTDRTPLWTAICEHSSEAFSCEIIEICATQAAADAAEAKWITELGTQYPAGFNVHTGRGGKMRAERRAKLQQQNLAKRSAMTERVLKLDDAGRSRQEIAAELGRTVQWTGEILRRGGRKMNPETRRRLALGAARTAVRAKTASLLERVVAMRTSGATWGDIGAALNRDKTSIQTLVKRAQKDGRLTVELPRGHAGKFAAKKAKVLALHDQGHSRQQIASELGLSDRWVSQILRQAGRGRAPRARQLLERAAAMRQAGARWAEIGAVLGLSEGGAYNLLDRARRDGRLPSDLNLTHPIRRQRRGTPRRIVGTPTMAETTAKAEALYERGYTREAIAAELGLAYRYICMLLRLAGHQTRRQPQISAGTATWHAKQRQKSAPLIERAVALQATGANWAEIGKALGLSESGAWSLVERARKDGRLPPEQLELSV
jgi:orotate phosphoribosyltransferase-like protein